MSVTSSAPTPRPALPLIASQGLRRTWAQHGWVGSRPVLGWGNGRCFVSCAGGCN